MRAFFLILICLHLTAMAEQKIPQQVKVNIDHIHVLQKVFFDVEKTYASLDIGQEIFCSELVSAQSNRLGFYSKDCSENMSFFYYSNNSKDYIIEVRIYKENNYIAWRSEKRNEYIMAPQDRK